jgi:hypothetical protein
MYAIYSPHPVKLTCRCVSRHAYHNAAINYAENPIKVCIKEIRPEYEM